MVNLSIKHENSTPCCVGIWHAVAGVLMILLGLYVWAYPFVSLLALSLYIGLALIVVGTGYIVSSLTLESGWFMFVGLLDIIVGIILVSNLGITAVTLPAIFAVWCLAVGTAQVISSYRFAQADLPWGWSMGLGILGLLFGFLILIYPVFGAEALGTLIGIYIMLYGILEIVEYVYFRRISGNQSSTHI